MSENTDIKKNKKSKKKKNKKSNKFLKTLKIIFFTLLFLGITGIIVAAGYTYAVIKTTPKLSLEEVTTLSQPSSLLDDNGDDMATVITTEQRIVVDSDTIPQTLKDAYVSIEDERFYSHKGIDVRRMFGAVLIDVKNKLTGKRGLHGASTLTQQLLKNTVLTNEVTIKRKVTEIYLAINLEKLLTKDEILVQYLNTIPLGGHAYGVEAASYRYFGKSVSELSLIESAYLAGTTQAPSYYDGLSEKNQKDPSSYINRTKTVLRKMCDLGKLTEAEYNTAVSDLDAGKLTFSPTVTSHKMDYEWFSLPAVDQVKKDLKEKYKYSDDEVNKLIMNGGLKIYTTMDRQLQEDTQAILNNKRNFNVANGETYDGEGVPNLQASAVVMDYRTGAVKAMVGGRGEQKALSRNWAYDESGLRPTGSSSKPLSVYAPAIDLKQFTVASIMSDSPLSADILRKYGYPSQPQNYDRQYHGDMTVRNALKTSNNISAIKIVDAIGLKNSIAYGEKFGLKYADASKTMSGLALGQFENAAEDRDGGNTFNMAAAYGAFGNNGVYTEPILYTKVIDATGKVLLDGTTKQRNVISPQSAYIMYDMLKGSASNLARSALFGNIPVAGKTGTTSSNKDLWFGGLTPYYSGAVWVGYGNNTVIKGSSGSVAGNLWGRIMAKAHAGLPYKDIETPSGLVKASICSVSGKLPTEACKAEGHEIITDYFIEGTVPNGYCSVHKQPEVIPETNENKPNVDEENNNDNTVIPPTDGNNNNNSNENNSGGNNNTGDGGIAKPPVDPNTPIDPKPPVTQPNTQKPNIQ